METKNKKNLESLLETKEFLKQRILDYITYSDRAFFEEGNKEMYIYYLKRAKETIDSIEEINQDIKDKS